MPEPQGNHTFLTELDIRIWLRDNDPEGNLLLDDYEFKPEEVRTAKTLAVDKWNDTPPFIANYMYTVDTFPYRSGLLKGTIANLLFIAGHLYRRNALKYNVPGGAVADLDKQAEYDAAGQRIWKEYVSWVMQTKRSLNMEMGFGIVGGGYW